MMKFIKRDGIHFKNGENKYYVAGCNYYNLLFSDRQTILAALDDMKEIGVNTVRIWGFNHQDTEEGMEHPKGTFHEKTFKVCDFVMDEARKRDMKIMIVFENFWSDYGGIKARLGWEGLPSETITDWAAFFTDDAVKQGYKNYVNHFVKRVNTINSTPYKEDDTLFAWELMNEPRYQDVSEEENKTGKTMRMWTDEMAGYVKSLDSNHMVGLGVEGHGERYGFAKDEGNDFVYVHQSPFIDFCTAHPYPDSEWSGLDIAGSKKLVEKFIYDAHYIVEKPFIMEEFNTTQFKDYCGYWRAMYDAIEEQDAAGDMFWCYMHNISSGYNLCKADEVIQKVFIPHAKFLTGRTK